MRIESWFFAATAGFVLSFAVASVVVIAAGVDPIDVLRVGITNSLGTASGLGSTLVFATPRLLVALGAIVAIRAGLFNLGGEGQLQLGAVGAALAGVLLGPMLAPVHVALALALAAAFGAAFAAVPAILQVWRGANLMITTLLMNFVGIYFAAFLVQGPFQEQGTPFNQSPRIHPSAELPVIIPGTRLHLGFLVAVGMTAAVGFLMSRTTLGFNLRSVGFNPTAARFAGLSISSLTVVAMAISGGISGLAGATEVLGVHSRLLQQFSTWIGFQGLAIAYLGGLRPLPTLLVAVLYGALENTIFQLQHELGLPGAVGLIVQGLPIVFLALFRGLALLRPGTQTDPGPAAEVEAITGPEDATDG
jgi:simple sugar transport system permease protein